MKKIFLSKSALLLNFSVQAQQKPASEIVTASMPQGARLLTREQLLNYTNNNLKKSQVPADKKNIYQIDGLIISFWDLSVNPEFKKSLKDSQSEMLEYLKRNSGNVINYSKIITVNNIAYLICEYQKQDDVYLWFKSDFDRENKNISGLIQFKEPDKDKAHKVLDEFLQTGHFKNE